MLWRNRRESDNVEDRRGFGGKTLGVGGLVVGAIIYTLMGGNPLEFLAQNVGQVQTQPSSQNTQPQNDDEKRFASVVMADTEDVWKDVFAANQITYRMPKLVLFTQAVKSGCGNASSAVGPFYCPADERVYLDLGFFRQLSQSLGARGDFAQAYVIAHEVGHHVQNLLGLDEKRQRQEASLNATGRNRVSVEFELQADCLAGIWAKKTDDAKKVIEEGDIDEAVTAAAAVGDDRLQQRGGGEVVPDSFTHGTSAQRAQAFRTGFAQGNTQSCLGSDLSAATGLAR